MHDTPATSSGAPADGHGDREPAAILDDDGLLRFGGRWVAVPDGQLPVVELLVTRQGHLVRNEELLDAHKQGGGVATDASLRPLIHRLRTRVSRIGLVLHVVRGRGVVLEPSRDEDET